MDRRIEKLGNLVRQFRREQGLTQAQLAEATGLGVRFICDVERGKESCALLETVGGDCAGALTLYPHGDLPEETLDSIEVLDSVRLQEILDLVVSLRRAANQPSS